MINKIYIELKIVFLNIKVILLKFMMNIKNLNHHYLKNNMIFSVYYIMNYPFSVYE